MAVGDRAFLLEAGKVLGTWAYSGWTDTGLERTWGEGGHGVQDAGSLDMSLVLLEESERRDGCLHSCSPLWGAAGTWMKLREEGKMLR